jgi:hypothetical protein
MVTDFTAIKNPNNNNNNYDLLRELVPSTVLNISHVKLHFAMVAISKDGTNKPHLLVHILFCNLYPINADS